MGKTLPRFFRNIVLLGIFFALTVLSVLFGLNIIDLPGISFPLAITAGIISSLMLVSVLVRLIEFGLFAKEVSETFPANQQKPPKIPDSSRSKKIVSESQTNQIQKILLIGDSRVGKTALAERYDSGQFNSHYSPTLAYAITKLNIINDKNIKLRIVDISGQECYQNNVSGLYKNNNGILLVFDINNRESFNNIRMWKAKVDENAKFILVGNKCDKDGTTRAVSQDDAQKLADELGIPYIETSAKTNTNVIECFTKLIEMIAASLVKKPKRSGLAAILDIVGATTANDESPPDLPSTHTPDPSFASLYLSSDLSQLEVSSALSEHEYYFDTPEK